jgi:hypothetical protein
VEALSLSLSTGDYVTDSASVCERPAQPSPHVSSPPQFPNLTNKKGVFSAADEEGNLFGGAMAANEEGGLFGGLPLYVEEEDPDSTAAKEQRAMRKAGGDWGLDKIRERRFMEEKVLLQAEQPIFSPLRVDPTVESPAGPMRHLPVSLKGPQLASSANIIFVKVVKSAIGYPLLVYGTIFVRDELDCKRICLFRRDRHSCQPINSSVSPSSSPLKNFSVQKKNSVYGTAAEYSFYPCDM